MLCLAPVWLPPKQDFLKELTKLDTTVSEMGKRNQQRPKAESGNRGWCNNAQSAPTLEQKQIWPGQADEVQEGPLMGAMCKCTLPLRALLLRILRKLWGFIIVIFFLRFVKLMSFTLLHNTGRFKSHENQSRGDLKLLFSMPAFHCLLCRICVLEMVLHILEFCCQATPISTVVLECCNCRKFDWQTN